MKIGKFRKLSADRKRYVVEYRDWMNEGETIEFVSVTGSVEEDDFYVDGYTISEDSKEVIFFVSGGVPKTEYDVSVEIQTSFNQIKVDTVTFVVT